MTDNSNRQRLNASLGRLQSALAKQEKADQRRDIRSGRSNALYHHAIRTIDELTANVTGKPVIDNDPKAAGQ
jgi:hypothetical protein